MAKKLPSFDSDPPAPTPASEEADRRLTGQILAAMPMLDDPRFAHSVILVCAHNADGAMGIILNRSLDRPNFEGLLKQLDISPVPPATPDPPLRRRPDRQRARLRAAHAGLDGREQPGRR